VCSAKSCILTIAIKTKEQGYRIASHQPLQNVFCCSAKHSARSQAHLLLVAHLRPRPIHTTNDGSRSFFRAHGSHAALLLDGRATGVRSPALAGAQEDGCSVCCSDEPEQCVDKVDPDGAFHADDTTLLGRWGGIHVDLAENAEECKPEDAVTTMSVNCGS
jgi:hypothetical protein